MTYQTGKRAEGRRRPKERGVFSCNGSGIAEGGDF
jgi:hypothetical protein